MKKVLQQFIKFGLVGGLCFVIDFAVSTIVYKILFSITGFTLSDVVGSVLGFCVSVIVNYILSMKFVFARREDMGRKTEFTIFLILSIFGCVLNTFVVWLCCHPIYENWTWLAENITDTVVFMAAKIVATAIVMVYNFVTRKIFLEQKSAE